MTTAEVRVLEAAARRHGLVFRRDALAAGLSRSTIDRRVAAGVWIPVDRGIYRPVAAPVTWRQQALAACSVADAWASHRSAAALWGMPTFSPRMVEVTAPHGARRSAPGVRWHETRLVDPEDFTLVDGIPTTTPARTLVDLAAVVVLPRLEEAMDDALRRKLISLSSMGETIERVAKNGRRGSLRIRRLYARRAGITKVESALEQKVLDRIRAAGLPAPAVQWPILVDGRCIARLDLAYVDAQLAIEVDGFRWHSSSVALHRDAARQRMLVARGWRVMHITHADLDHFSSVANEIRAALDPSWQRPASHARSDAAS